jgi:hypothetical protein
MNAKNALLLIAALTTSTAYAADDPVRADVRELPQAVRESLERSHAGEPVKEVTRQSLNGQNVYIIEIDRNNAPNPRIRIAEDGTIMRGLDPATRFSTDGTPILDPYAPGPLPVFPKLKLAELP